MPKGKGKKKGGRVSERKVQESLRPGAQRMEEDSDNVSEAGSVFSVQSEFVEDTGAGVTGGVDNEVDDISLQEEFESRLAESVDALSEKSAKTRQDALKSIHSALSQKLLMDFLEDRKMTLTDALERSLKKGKGEEQSQAANTCSALCIQLGAYDDVDVVFRSLHSTLLTVMLDNSAATKARSSCASCIGVCCFITGGENENLVKVMESLANIFKASFHSSGAKPALTPDMVSLHASALAAWSLLLTVAPPGWASSIINNYLPRLQELLDSPDVELRIVAGEVVALCYELARIDNEDFEGSDIDGLCEKLRMLATDSNKYRAKKDRRQQRSSFRDILRAVEEGDFHEYSVKFGTEKLVVDSWMTKRQYDSLCQCLGAGMNLHLRENDLVRDIFRLGAPLTADDIKLNKISKVERQMYQAAAFKARTLVRGKARDKRMDFG